ncbi:unnamed protein product, partial [Staurois parvus]
CPIIGISGRNSAPSLVSLGGIAPHHWCQWNSAPSLVSVGGIVSHHWCQWGGGIVPHRWCQWGGRNSIPSLVSVGGGIVPHHWCQGQEKCPIVGVSGRN